MILVLFLLRICCYNKKRAFSIQLPSVNPGGAGAGGSGTMEGGRRMQPAGAGLGVCPIRSGKSRGEPFYFLARLLPSPGAGSLQTQELQVET